MPTRVPSRHLIATTCLILALAALRVTRLDAMLNLTPDEVWSVWQSSGTPAQTIARTPFDWPSGYFLLVGGWQSLVGAHPIVLRYGMTLCFLVGAAGAYRAGRRFWGSRLAGVLVTAAYGFGGWSVYMTTLVRGHGLTFAVAPVVLWLALRYTAAPTIRRGIPAALVLASLLYIHATTAVFIGAVGLFMLVLGGWRALRAWIPLGVTVGLLVLPEVISKLRLAVESRAGLDLPPVPLTELLWRYFGERVPQLGGYGLALIAVAVGLALFKLRERPRKAAALAVWLIFPLVLLLPPLRDIFTTRYTNWYMAGLALAVGGGLSILPRPAGWAAAVALVVVGALPFDVKQFDSYGPDIATALDGVSRNMQAADVMMLDPRLQNADYIAPEVWDYYREVYFPVGMPLMSAGDAATLAAPDAPPAAWDTIRRVWYIHDLNRSDTQIRNTLRETHIPREFHGPPNAFAQLYEGPPSRDGVLFENGIRFHGVDILEDDGVYNTQPTPVFSEASTLRLRSWWSVDASPELDYSISVYMLNRDGSLAATDDLTALVQLAPGEDPPPATTSAWEPNTYYTAEHTLPVTDVSARVALSVYQWWDGVRVSGETTDADGLLTPFRFTIKAW